MANTKSKKKVVKANGNDTRLNSNIYIRSWIDNQMGSNNFLSDENIKLIRRDWR